MIKSTITKKEAGERYIEAVGRRKTAVARVRITPSPKNTFVINEKELEAYFPIQEMQVIVKGPLEEVQDKFTISAHISGGGVHSQSEALRHGISRTLIIHNAELRKSLKKAGYLKRDPRSKERRKFGLKKARKAPQWSKR